MERNTRANVRSSQDSRGCHRDSSARLFLLPILGEGNRSKMQTTLFISSSVRPRGGLSAAEGFIYPKLGEGSNRDARRTQTSEVRLGLGSREQSSFLKRIRGFIYPDVGEGRDAECERRTSLQPE